MRLVFKYQLFNKRNKRQDVKLRPIKVKGFTIQPVIIPRRSNKEKRNSKFDAYAIVNNNWTKATIARQHNKRTIIYARSTDYNLKEILYTIKEDIRSRMTPVFLFLVKLSLLDNKTKYLQQELSEIKHQLNNINESVDDSCFAVDNISEELFNSLSVDHGMTSPIIHVSEKDAEFLLNMIENPPPPSNLLISAIKEYKAQLSEGKIVVKEIFQQDNKDTKH